MYFFKSDFTVLVKEIIKNLRRLCEETFWEIKYNITTTYVKIKIRKGI